MIRRVIILASLLFISTSAYAQDKPNIVLVFMDNFGWGEPGFNGGGGSSAARRHRESISWLPKAYV